MKIRGKTMDVRTRGRSATLNAAPREGRIKTQRRQEPQMSLRKKK